MNKNLHRIIFNAARGMRMVVHETARGAGKSNSTTTGLAASLVASCLAWPPRRRRSSALPTYPATSDPPCWSHPTVSGSSNIQTPSAAGVSRNVYSRFDIERNGAHPQQQPHERADPTRRLRARQSLAHDRPGARDPQRGQLGQSVASSRLCGSGRPACRGRHRQPGGHSCRRRRLHQRLSRHADYRRAATRRIGRPRWLPRQPRQHQRRWPRPRPQPDRLRRHPRPAPCRSTQASGPTT